MVLSAHNEGSARHLFVGCTPFLPRNSTGYEVLKGLNSLLGPKNGGPQHGAMDTRKGFSVNCRVG